jgi:hypothetical protein
LSAHVDEPDSRILVPDLTDKRLYPQALLRLDCFDFIAMSEEDRNRSKMYVIDELSQRVGAVV